MDAISQLFAVRVDDAHVHRRTGVLQPLPVVDLCANKLLLSLLSGPAKTELLLATNRPKQMRQHEQVLFTPDTAYVPS